MKLDAARPHDSTRIGASMRPLRISIADRDPEVRAFYRRVATEMGHTVVCEMASGRQLVEQCPKQGVELVISEIALDEVDGLEAAIELSRLAPTAFIVATELHDPQTVVRATGDHVMCFLIKPVKESDLQVSIPLARARFEQFKALHKEYYDAQTALRDRELIDRAKAIFMRELKMSEHEAYRRLQELSWTKNLKMSKLAEMIITADEALVRKSNKESTN